MASLEALQRRRAAADADLDADLQSLADRLGLAVPPSAQEVTRAAGGDARAREQAHAILDQQRLAFVLDCLGRLAGDAAAEHVPKPRRRRVPDAAD